MPSLGMPELIVILVLALVIFGAGKLPSVGKALGQSIHGFKEEMDTEQNEDHKDAKEA